MEMINQSNNSGAKVIFFGLQEGDATKKTLSVMSNIVQKYKKNIKIRELAQKIINHVPEKNWPGEAAALQNWVRDNVRYTKDVNEVETVSTPDHTLFTLHGDCDDHAVLLASLLESVGHPTRFVAIGLMPGQFNHVYTEVKINNKWFPVETTEDWKFGQHPPKWVSRLEYDNKGGKTMNGLQAIIEADEAELDAALEMLVTNALLEKERDELAGCMGDAQLLEGFFKRLKKRVRKVVKRIKPIVKKVAKAAAVGAAVYFTGGAAIGLIGTAAQAKAQAKAQASAIEQENAAIEAQNREIEQMQLAEQQAAELAARSGVNMQSPQARKILSQAVKIESAKLKAGLPVEEKSMMQKLLPVAAVGLPVVAMLAS